MLKLNKNSIHWLIAFAALVAAKIPQFAADKAGVINDISANAKQTQAQWSNPYTVQADEVRFKIDTAKLTIKKMGSHMDAAVEILSLSDYCYECSYYTVGIVDSKQSNMTILVNSKWPTSIQLRSSKLNCNTSFRYFYGERGEYEVFFMAFENGTCRYTDFKVITHPWNSYIPIAVAFVILCVLALFYTIAKWIYKNKSSSGSTSVLISNDLGAPELDVTDEQDPTNVSERVHITISPKRERLKSIDTFRGLCLIVMIFVNFGGGNYWFFNHVAWHGLTVADLVFPWFMFIMGVNITLSIDSLLRRNTPASAIAYKVIRRTLILFALGITIINQNTNWYALRVPGVLQRFSIAYLFGFLIQWAFHKSPAELDETNDEGQPWWFPFRDVVRYWPQWLIALAFEALWICLTFLLPVPGCPTGYIGPGGLAEDGKYLNHSCIGGAAGYIDRWMFGEAHIYGHPTAKAVYYPMLSNDEKVPYDPEGVLGSINGCLIVFLGSQMGKIFLYYKSPKQRAVRWLVWCVLLGAISIILCKASANEGWIPVNKNLWTTTFITTLSSMAFFLMTVIYYLVDVYKIWSGSPLDFVGMNSILLYVGHEVLHDYLPFNWGATEYSTHAEYLAMNMLGVSYWVLIAYYCYRIKFFVKI